ncbi:hypothetical protein [Desulfobulbus elongatus]|uniref:hypothetical protein n=1 Tax=Desulfobulbus elongatus TaxID=53332 RepID=UPI000688C561|nr:hypothetical protein [Desulfobulbus elongatus]
MDQHEQVNEAVAGLSADRLKGRQSVRATFKLPLPVIELLSIAADQLGLKQKSLFDQLVEDRQILEQLALRASSYRPVQAQRQQKTYVVSRNSLLALDHVAKVHRLPRDLLVEISIQRLVPVLSAEQEKQRHRRCILGDLELWLVQGQGLLEESRRMLGDEDPTVRRMAAVVGQLRADAEALAEQVEQGRVLEKYL